MKASRPKKVEVKVVDCNTPPLLFETVSYELRGGGVEFVNGRAIVHPLKYSEAVYNIRVYLLMMNNGDISETEFCGRVRKTMDETER